MTPLDTHSLHRRGFVIIHADGTTCSSGLLQYAMYWHVALMLAYCGTRGRARVIDMPQQMELFTQEKAS